MLKIKTDIYLAIFLLFFVCACAHDEMDEMPLTQDEIKFVATSGKVTRAGGETSLAKYIDNFRVYGINTNNTNTLVFDNYVLWYDQQLSNSNTNYWEYVGRNPIDDDKLQTIKYWNFSANQYYFWAVAGAKGRSFTPDESNGMIETFSTTMTEVDGSASVLYYSKPLKVNRNNYSHPVTFHFVGAHSRMRMAFYETIPGYAVKDVYFHISTSATQLSECTANGAFNVAGTLTLRYDNTTPDVTCSFAGTETPQASHSFGSLNYTTAASGALAQNGKSDYLGVLSSAPTYAGNPETPGYYTNILPSPDNNTPLTIKVDYTLVSLDGSGQEINITGADATVPAEFCKWKSNYSYTYLFKISDDKLKPITFVAVGEVDNTTDNEQGTITTIGDCSITTHQNGDTDADGIAYEPYVVGKHIEIAVVSKVADNEASQITLDGSNDYVKIYHQTTSYEWIVETTTEPGAAVSVDNYTNGIASFNPEQIGTYRIEYWHKEDDADAEKKAVKIVSVGAQLYSTDHTGTDLGNGGDSSFKPIETH